MSDERFVTILVQLAQEICEKPMLTPLEEQYLKGVDILIEKIENQNLKRN